MALTGFATLAIAGGWIWLDWRSMAGIEHYEREGWWLVVIVGGYAAALLWGVGRGILGGYIRVRGRRS